MYETFYGLAGNAFKLTPDCRFKFPYSSYTDAADTLLQAIQRGEGFALVTGAPGTGKTTLINDLAAQLRSDGYSVGIVVNSQVDADDLLRLVGFAFGLQADAVNKTGLMAHLMDQLANNGRSRPAILIIDEAQDLTVAALEELRLLRNLTVEHRPLVQILLSGQERIRDRLREPECERLRQLVATSCRLFPLNSAETRAYILQALNLMGWTGDPEISAGALHLIHERARGVPRLINLTMGRLLLHGGLSRVHRLDAQDVETVLAQLGKDHPDLLPGTMEELRLPAPIDALLPVNSQAVKEPEHHRDSHWRNRFSFAALAETRDAATQYLERGFQRLAGRDRKRALRGFAKGLHVRFGRSRSALMRKWDAAMQCLSSRFQRISSARWRWTLSGLSAALGAVLISSLVDMGGSPSVSKPPPEAGPVQEPRMAERKEIDPPAAKGIETPLDPSVSLAPVPQDAEALTLSTEGGGTEAEALAHEQVGIESALPGAETAPGGSQALFADAPAFSADRIESDDGAFLDGAQEDQGQAVQEEDVDEIGVLLAKAEQALSEDRLTVPSKDNAYKHFGAVLALDPENSGAREGMERIVARYRELARQRLNRGDRRGARRFASRGLEISPQDQELQTIERRATGSRVARRAPAEPRVPEVLKRIERWFRSVEARGSAFFNR